MRDSFLPDSPGAGSHGDPGLDALLTDEVTERLLGGWPRHAAISPELRQLRETVDALRGSPSRSELEAESLAVAAFRQVSGSALDDTLVYGTGDGGATGPGRVPVPAGRGPRRARHRARPAGRPAGGLPRPVLRRPRALGTVAALALLAIVGLFAYAGSLPGPIQNAAHVAFGAPSVRTATPPAPTTDGSGSQRASGSPMSGARVIKPSAGADAKPPASASAPGPRQWCQAYLSDPWKPGAKSWDKADFEKLSKVAPGGSQWVLWYCSKYVDVPSAHGGMTFFFPPGYPGGAWAWTPGHSSAGPVGVPGTGPDGAQDPTAGPGPANVSGHSDPTQPPVGTGASR
jgi:hypothetical protein